jgi:hypothetical protein
VKRRFRLSPQFVLPVTVAGREVKCDKAGYTRSSCYLAGLARGQMPCLRGDIGIHFEERRFNEQVVCVVGEGDNLFKVLVMIGDVDHISDFLPTRYAQGMLSENAQRHGQIAVNGNLALVRRALSHRALGCSKPGPYGKPKPSEPFAPDIDAQLLLKSESKAWDAVVEQGSVNVKFAFFDEHTRR